VKELEESPITVSGTRSILSPLKAEDLSSAVKSMIFTDVGLAK
jgi:hypothetical protein